MNDRHLATGLLFLLVLTASAAEDPLQRLAPPGGFPNPEWVDPAPGKWATVDVTQKGVTPGDQDQTAQVQALVDGTPGPAILHFPAGTYCIGKITLRRGDLIIRGDGPDKTVFKSTKDGTVFLFQGVGGTYDYKYLSAEYQPRAVTAEVPAGGRVVPLADTSKLAPGDLVIVEEDLNEWTYDSARRGRGGVFAVEKVEPNQITLDLPLALGLEKVKPDEKRAIVAKMKPLRNTGLENFRIELPAQKGETGSAIYYKRCQNAYVRNVEVWNPSQHHLEAQTCRGVIVSGCFFDEAKSKGGGGYGYGVLFRDLSTLCKAENNIFKDLRHTLATEVGASYCVFAYNLNVDRVRDRCMQPDVSGDVGTEKWINSRAANGISEAMLTADVVAHGNMPHTNLLEGNVFYNGCVDISHKLNGPQYFFRNRPLGQPKKYGYWQEGAGIVVMGANDGQVIVGNYLANESTILLQKHDAPRSAEHCFIAANVVKGATDWGALPPNTALPKSLFLKDRPAWWPKDLAWPAYGPDVPASATNKIPAQVRWEQQYKKKGLKD
ncbi:MAG: hypothetical protein KIS92_23795 [Planctomycetota bacterium]|nr:hypothetical protein [Planctomycetota bacterium]